LDAWYHRYESSNFSKPGVSSIHNRVYRTMQNYIGFWPSASSFSRLDGLEGLEGLDGLGGLDKEVKALRWTNTSNLVEYLKGDYIDQSKTVFMTEKDLLIESFFLWLRTDTGVSDLDKYISILVKNYKELVEAYKDEWLLYDVDDRLLLTDKGMDVSNTIITDLLKDI
jgi:oxygen-independent coproporphyrinogen-3 oxidase